MRIGTVLISLLLAIIVSGCAAVRAADSPKTTQAPTGQCRISLVDEEQFSEFTVNEVALEVPSEEKFQRAYFAMGCFWGSEALMASAPGVVETRVGFSGGTLPNPSYSAIGDHVETVEVLFDPERVSYAKLVHHFWRNHNSRAKPIFRQYASAVFCLDEEQLKQAKAEREEWQKRGQEEILTAVMPFEKFYPAADNHQKYYLQQDKKLFSSLPEHSRLSTRLASKLNAVSGRAGMRNDLEQALAEFGIEQQARDTLFRRALWQE